MPYVLTALVSWCAVVRFKFGGTLQPVTDKRKRDDSNPYKKPVFEVMDGLVCALLPIRA